MARTRIVGFAFAGLLVFVSGGAAARHGVDQTLQEQQQKSATPVPTTASPRLGWITLGTQGGPSPSTDRSQPANLLLVNGQPWIVDCGDGAMERLAAAGFQPTQVQTAFISHLHLDHIGGLWGLIALHWAPGAGGTSDNVLTIYGPPGTDVVVKGILQSLTPTAQMNAGKPGPELVTRVVIVKDGSDLTVNGVHVRVVRNSHFDGSPADLVSQSLSYRYDYEGYAIGYTGDTGPSDAVTRLEKGADVLVSEVADPAAVASRVASITNSTLPPETKSANIRHFEMQHLSPQEAGKIAEGAGVRLLVFTHTVSGGTFNAVATRLINGAHETFKGEVIVARDLDRF